MRSLHLAVVALSIGLAMVVSTGAQAQSCGDTLTADTTLTAALTCTGPGLIIGADSITLDCANFTITGGGSDAGILLDGRTGVNVMNCTVINFAAGIILTGSSSNYLTANGALDNTSIGNGGFQLSSGSNNNVLEFSRSAFNVGRGYIISSSSGNLMINNGATDNGFRGFDLIDATGNTVMLNSADGNSSGGFVVSGASSGNTLYRNRSLESGSEGFALLSPGNSMILNRAKANGTFGIVDTTGPANFYTGNACVANVSGPSSPGGLC